jgi:hypothetical protein
MKAGFAKVFLSQNKLEIDLGDFKPASEQTSFNGNYKCSCGCSKTNLKAFILIAKNFLQCLTEKVDNQLYIYLLCAWTKRFG